MVFIFSIHTTVLLLLLVNAQLGLTFTVIMSDSGAPSALVDGPQSGASISNDGSKTDPNEQEAVYDIMRATGNDWAVDIQDVCRGRWHGIECMPDKENVFHVVSLSFGALSDDTAFPTCDNLKSFISPSIVKLPHLRNLFFYRCLNNNPQPIPSFLGQLGSTLQTLVLRDNGHIGPIPYEIGNLTHLTILDLHRNNLNDSIPFSLGRVTGLRSLDLSGNRLSGPIPNISLPSLSVLDLNQNHLTNSIPTQLLSSNSLLKIDLSRNRLSGPLPNFNYLEDLILLDLSHNTLSSMPSIKNLKSLQALILNDNPLPLTTLPKDTFEGLDNLISLGLSNMNLVGPIPESLGRLVKLRVIHLDRNQLNGTIPPSLAELNGLTELMLENNKLSGPVPFKRETIWKMRRKLRLNDNLSLCYNDKSGLGDDLDTLAGVEIGPCNELEIGPTVSVRHISADDETNHSGASIRQVAMLSKMIEMTVVLLFVFLLV